MKETQLTISVPQAAKRLGIGRNAAYRAVACGEIPAVRIGKLWRVPVRQLDRMLDQVAIVQNRQADHEAT